MFKMKTCFLLITVIIVILSLGSCNKATTPVSNSEAPKLSGEPVKIGLLTSITGNRALTGEYALNTLKIVLEEINGNGGILGHPLEVVVEDNLGTDVGEVTAYRKLAAQNDIVAIISGDSSNSNLAISPDVRVAKIVTIAPGSSPTLRDECKKNPYLYQLRACDDTLCYALIKYAVEVKGYKTFAIINDTETSSSDAARLFTEALKSYGITPLVNVYFTTGTKDFTSQLVKIQAAKPDCVIGCAFSNDVGILTPQIKMLMEDTPMIGSTGFGDPIALQLAGDSLEGACSGAAYIPSNTFLKKNISLAEEYRRRYNQEESKAGAQVYDQIYILKLAIERAGSIDREAVFKAMRTIDNWEGVVTTYDLTTNWDCGRGGVIAQVKDGDLVVIENIYVPKVK
jgi:branched-chain amino acid transport system substrate-binding protein